MICPPRIGTLLIVGMAVAATLAADRSDAEGANQATMIVLLIGAGVSGARAGRLWPLAAVVVGLALPISHVVLIALGAPPVQEPTGYLGALSLAVLVVPAAIAAAVGSALSGTR